MSRERLGPWLRYCWINLSARQTVLSWLWRFLSHEKKRLLPCCLALFCFRVGVLTNAQWSWCGCLLWQSDLGTTDMVRAKVQDVTESGDQYHQTKKSLGKTSLLIASPYLWELHQVTDNMRSFRLVLCRFASCALRWSDALIGLDMMFLIAAQTTSFWSILSSLHRVPGSTSVRSRRVTCVSNSFRSSCCAYQVVGLWSALNSNESFSNTGKCL